MQTVPVHATILHDLPVHLVPGPLNARILLPITPHGRPAGEQWRGEPGVVFACRTGSSPAVWGRAIPVPPYSSKNRRPEAVSSHYFTLPEAKPASGSAHLPQPSGPPTARRLCLRCHKLTSRSKIPSVEVQPSFKRHLRAA